MPKFNVRSSEMEIMDDFSIGDDGLKRTLRELEIINYWLGGNQVTINGIKTILQLYPKTQTLKGLSMADLGCGSGDILRLISNKFSNKYLLNLTGVDANPTVIEFAENRTDDRQIQYQVGDILSDNFQKQKFDLILCTLFIHHFPDEQLIQMLNTWKHQTKIGVVINDLHRHWFAFYSIKWLTHFFSKSYMTKYDAKLSVLRAFKKHELENIIKQSGWKNYKIRWKWAFRWEVRLWH